MAKIKQTLASIVLGVGIVLGIGNEVNKAEAEPINYSLFYNGQNSKVAVADSPSLDFSSSEGLTLSAWFNIYSHLRTENAIVSKWGPGGWGDTDDEWNFNIMQNGSLEFYLNSAATHGSPNTQLNSGFPVSLNEWHNAIGIWDRVRGIGELYLDGILVDSTDEAITSMPNTSQTLYIGYGHYGSGFYQHFHGLIDEVKIFNTPKTLYEIAADDSGLIAYWRFNEGQGLTTYDISGYNNHGTIYNAEWMPGQEPVPEPSTMALFGIAGLGLGAAVYSRRKPKK